MANVVTVNQLMNSIPGTTDTALMLLYGLKVNLKAAGWTVVQSSNGTSFGASDYWSSYPTTGGWWIVLQGPGGRQLCFWVNTTYDLWTGKIIYVPGGQSGFTFASASATNPGTIPAGAVYVRGSGAAFASWFGGGTKAIKYAQVLCKDSADGSFWVLGSTPTTTAGSFYHFLAFNKCISLDAGDPDPYVWYCSATTATTDTGTGSNAHLGGILCTASENAAISGAWWGWGRGVNWRSYQPTYDYLAASAGDINPYDSSANVLSPFGICKTEANYREHKGYLANAKVCAISGLAIGDTVNENGSNYTYVCVGYTFSTTYPQALFWWDGTTAAMLLN